MEHNVNIGKKVKYEKPKIIFDKTKMAYLVRKKTGGYKIVLTADRTLMSKYAGGIFLGAR